jgi:hypothetical protein
MQITQAQVDKAHKTFSAAVQELFNIFAMKATKASQRDALSRCRKLYALTKEQVGVAELMHMATPSLVARSEQIIHCLDEEFLSGKARGELMTHSPDDFIVSLFDSGVEFYVGATAAERTFFWRQLNDVFTSCMLCAAYRARSA